MTPDHKVWQGEWKQAKDADYDAAIRFRGEALEVLSRASGGQSPTGQPEMTEVFDILDCGPRNQFAVRPAGGGEAFIVHNCQSLAAQVIMYYAKVVFDLTGIRPCHQVHDELIWMVNEKDAENFRRVALHVMHQAPIWWPELDLAAEASKPALSYGAS
jgi:hypothetical protein